VTRTPLSRSKCQKSTMQGAGAYCGGLPHSLFTTRWLDAHVVGNAMELQLYDSTSIRVLTRQLLDGSKAWLWLKTSSGHSLYHLLPRQRVCTNLRSRGHDFQLPDYNCSTLPKRSKCYSFIIWVCLICLIVLNYWLLMLFRCSDVRLTHLY